MFLMAAEEGGEYELIYFKRLDDEFNKVVKFYKSKVEEVVKEAVELNKQMDAFIAFVSRSKSPTGISITPRRLLDSLRILMLLLLLLLPPLHLAPGPPALNVR